MNTVSALHTLAALVAAELPPARRAPFLDAVDDQVLRPFRGHPSRAEEARRMRVVDAGNKRGMAIHWSNDGRQGEGIPDWADHGINWCFKHEGRIPTSVRDWDLLEKAVTSMLGKAVV